MSKRIAPDGTKYEFSWNSARARHEIRFSAKPSAQVRENMKRHGARWSPTLGIWYIAGFTYAGDDIPLIIDGDESAGCHGRAVAEDERVYGGSNDYDY